MAKIFKIILSLTVFLYTVANDIPSAPEILSMECRKVSAILSWSPTGEAPVTEYIVQYKTNWSNHKWINFEFNQLKEKNVALILSPWANYTFRVIAKNNAGVSPPSGVSDICETDEDVPYKNPELVYGRGNGPNNLVISWKPMPPIDQNAPGFYYKVFWRQNDVSEDVWHTKIVHDWKQHKLVIENLPKLTPFRVKVEAYNSMGKSNAEAKEVIGYSDEDKPTEFPKKFSVLEIIDGKSAKLKWEPVSPVSINGHFKGYKVQSWTENEENKTEIIIPANVTTAVVKIFTPGKVNSAQVLAFNGAFDGPPSDPIEITMPEDIYPDTPSFVWTRVTDQNNKAVIRITSEPNLTNSNPGKKIYIQYRKKGIDNLDKWESTVPENIEDAKQPVDLVNLEFDTFYEIKVIAKSGKLESSSNISLIDTRVEKWPKTTTTSTTTTKAPETMPSVLIPSGEVREESNEEQKVNHNSVWGFTPGVKKEDSKIAEDFVDENDNGEDSNFSKTPWFIALLCVLAFICAFVGVFIFIKRRRHEDGAKINSRQTNDVVRTEPKNTNATDRQEFNTFIVPMDNRNGNAGHDEGDSHDDTDYEDGGDRGRPYNSTTKRINNT